MTPGVSQGQRVKSPRWVTFSVASFGRATQLRGLHLYTAILWSTLLACRAAPKSPNSGFLGGRCLRRGWRRCCVRGEGGRPFWASVCGSDPGTIQCLIDSVVDMSVGNRDRCFAVPSFQFIDIVMDIPVVRYTRGANCAENRGASAVFEVCGRHCCDHAATSSRAYSSSRS